jgi:hypothetical protein
MHIAAAFTLFWKLFLSITAFARFTNRDYNVTFVRMKARHSMIVSQHFIEPEGSIPNSQELSTCSYP